MSLPVTTYIDNAQTPAQVSTVGFKVSKPGYDANTASGANMVFNSSWPSLPIVLSVTVTNTITSSTSANIVIPHNLGYPPFAMAWAYGTDPIGGSIPSTGSRFIPMADSTNIYINGRNPPSPLYGNTVATKILVLVYAIDLSTDIDYTLAPGATFNLPYDNSYGIKFVKAGKDINSKDMRDFAIHSRCQSPLIQAVKTQATSNTANTSTVQYTNKTKTPIWFYGFIKAAANGLGFNLHVPDNTYCPAPYYSQAYPATFTDGITAYVTYLTGTFGDFGASLVVLRDPMFASNQVTVQY